MATREEWRRRILDDLGGEGVDPDLTESQLDAALSRASECWNKYRPFGMWFPFEVPMGETLKITFFSQPPLALGGPIPDPGAFADVKNVIAVEFSDSDRRRVGPRSGFLEGYYIRWGAQGPRTFFEMHTGQRLYERLTGSRPDWRWDEFSRTLYLSVPSRDVRAMVFATRQRRIEELRFDHETDFRRLAVASAKRTLARVLGSRGPIPGPAGVIETDSKELRVEAETEWKEIEERLQHALASVPPPSYVG